MEEHLGANHELSITIDEANIAIPIVSAAKNDLRRRCGYSPSQWLFGRQPQLQAELLGPDSGKRSSGMCQTGEKVAGNRSDEGEGWHSTQARR